MLRLELKQKSSVPLEVEGLTPDVVKAMSLAEIEKFPIFQGNRKIPLGEFFQVTGDASDETFEWHGDLTGVHWIGTKMQSGRMQIHGSCGRHLGSEMRGGEIHVAGDAGDWVGGEMHGGLIHVRGRAGHLIGAAYRGSAIGMTKGTILIGGDAGNEIGHTLRRGLIAIGGNCGDLAGFNMLAGTILLFGETGIRHGAGMRRGTIGFFGPAPQILPTFRKACRYTPDTLRLLAQELRRLDFPKWEQLMGLSVDLYNGDLIEGGRGELLVRAA
jgi:formylmethanofuran dehydrogenase subunit C